MMKQYSSNPASQGVLEMEVETCSSSVWTSVCGNCQNNLWIIFLKYSTIKGRKCAFIRIYKMLHIYNIYLFIYNMNRSIKVTSSLKKKT